MEISRGKVIIMKRTSAVICEFNPFHDGHERLLQNARENGADRVVCIMSGNFVQRGEPAIADKYTRAKTALLAGADLVLELPMPFSAASAEYFACAGVEIAERLGCIDELLFGSELGDIGELGIIAKNQLSDAFTSLLREKYSGENGYASSAQTAYEELFGKNPALASPNNILAIEYIKALTRLGSRIEPRTVRREDNFSSDTICTDMPSAAALRRLIESGETEKIKDYMPSACYAVLAEAQGTGRFPINMDKYGFAVLSAMRLASPEKLALCKGVCGGLENRIIQSALNASSFEELMKLLSTKKYTDARLRRTLLFSLLGVMQSDMSLHPFYVELLAVNEQGRELLSSVRKNAGIAVVTKLSDKKAVINSLCESEKADAERLFQIERKAEALYTICLDETREASFFEKKKPIIEK